MDRECNGNLDSSYVIMPNSMLRKVVVMTIWNFDPAALYDMNDLLELKILRRVCLLASWGGKDSTCQYQRDLEQYT